jgi:hypothetical protein
MYPARALGRKVRKLPLDSPWGACYPFARSKAEGLEECSSWQSAN